MTDYASESTVHRFTITVESETGEKHDLSVFATDHAAALTAAASKWPQLEPVEFCPDCGYLWSLHDNRVTGSLLPFGCPSELEARAAAGDR